MEGSHRAHVVRKRSRKPDEIRENNSRSGHKKKHRGLYGVGAERRHGILAIHCEQFSRIDFQVGESEYEREAKDGVGQHGDQMLRVAHGDLQNGVFRNLRIILRDFCDGNKGLGEQNLQPEARALFHYRSPHP